MTKAFDTMREQLYKTLFELYKDEGTDTEVINRLLEKVKSAYTIEHLGEVNNDLNNYLEEKTRLNKIDIVDDLITLAYTRGIVERNDALVYNGIVRGKGVDSSDIHKVLNKLLHSTCVKLGELKDFKDKVENVLEDYPTYSEFNIHIQDSDFCKFNLAMDTLFNNCTEHSTCKDKMLIRANAYSTIMRVLKNSAKVRYESQEHLEFCLMLKETFGSDNVFDNFISNIKDSII